MSDPNQHRSQPRYQPTTRRQRLKIIAVTAATVVTLWFLLIWRPGGHPRVIPPPAAQLPCPAGQTSGCVGGQADVMLLPMQATSAPVQPH